MVLTIIPAMIIIIFLLILLRQRLNPKPGMVQVISGRTFQNVDGKPLGYRLVIDQSTFVCPIIERVESITLKPIPFILEFSVFTSENRSIRLQGEGAVQLIPEEPEIHRAIQRFLGKSHEDIATIGRETLEGNIRSCCATKTIEEIQENITDDVTTKCSSELTKLGLQLSRFRVDSIVPE